MRRFQKYHVQYFAAGLLIGFWFGLFAEHFVTYAAAQGYPGLTVPRNPTKGGTSEPNKRPAYPGVTIPRNRDTSRDAPRTVQPYDYNTRNSDRSGKAQQRVQNNRVPRNLSVEEGYAPPGTEKIRPAYRRAGRQLVDDVTRLYQSVNVSALDVELKSQLKQRIANRALAGLAGLVPPPDQREPGTTLQWFVAMKHDVIVRGPRDSVGRPLTGERLTRAVREIEAELLNVKKIVRNRLETKDELLAENDPGVHNLKFYQQHRKNYAQAGQMADKALTVLRKKYGK